VNNQYISEKGTLFQVENKEILDNEKVKKEEEVKKEKNEKEESETKVRNILGTALSTFIFSLIITKFWFKVPLKKSWAILLVVSAASGLLNSRIFKKNK
jgi:Na+/citrate or Na+/malate symporter